MIIIEAWSSVIESFIMVSGHATTAVNQSSTMTTSSLTMASSSSTSSMSSGTPMNLVNQPLLLLSNMSNMMTVKLDNANYIVWKHQITMVLETYSLYELLEEPQLIPEKFLKDLSGSYTTIVNPDFLIWKSKEKALLTFINSTLSPSVLALIVGCASAIEVWKVLENSFSSVSRSHIMNLKCELHNLRKGNDIVDVYLQKIKVVRVPSIASNLASVQKLCHDYNCWCYFDEDILSIQALDTRKILYQGRSEGGVYLIYPNKASQLFLSPKACNNTSKSSVFNKTLWHMRLGHPNDQALHCLFLGVRSIHTNNVEDHTCTHCLYGKMHNLSFPHSDFKAFSPFELVHFDLWGPAPVGSINGYKYYILFVDHYSRFSWLYLLKSKSEAFTKSVHFNAMVANQFSLNIKTFRSDDGGEFTSNEFKTCLSNHGIAHHISYPYTPQQNGVVERKHRHIIETAIALLSQASLSYSFWTFAVQTAISLINVLPTSVLDWQSPWSTLYSTSPDVSQFKVFGCACYPNLRPYTAHKLEPRTRECLFI